MRLACPVASDASESTLFGSFTLHVQLGLGWDVFQNGWDGSQPLRREAVPNGWDPSQQIQGL